MQSDAAGKRTFHHWSALVRDLMTSDVVAVEPTATVKDVAHLFIERDIRMVPVVDIDGLLVGVVSEADLISREGFPAGRRHGWSEQVEYALDERRHHWSTRAEGVTAGEVMTEDVSTCAQDEPIAVAARRLLHENVRSLPVVEQGRLVGVLSRHDVLSLFDRPDAEVRDTVRDLLDDPVWAPEECRVTVRVRDGVVTLEGSTRFERDVKVLEAMVKDVPGVVGVTNLVYGKDRI